MKVPILHNTDSNSRDFTNSPSGPLETNSSIQTHLITRYRRLQAVGGFLLASTFFAPAEATWGSPINAITILIPDFSCLVYDIRFIIENPDNLSYLAAFVLLFGGYIFGLLVFLNRLGSKPHSTLKKATSFVLSLHIGIMFLSSLFVHLSLCANYAVNMTGLVWIVLSLSFCAYWFLCLRAGNGGAFSLRLGSSLLMASWFILLIWFLDDEVLCGLWLSVYGCSFIAFGTFMEGKLLNEKSYLRTLFEILFVKLNLSYNRDNCRNCGYLLFGLSSNRCPECGTLFVKPVPVDAASRQYSETTTD